MPDETAQQRTERQNRLSHAMGVMFLQDKVDKLERDVSKITYPRSMRHTHSAPTAELGSTQPKYHAANPPPKPRAITGPGLTPTTTANPSTSTSTAKAATCMRLVDASVLIFSLRSVHNWTRDRVTCVIIPLEAINTLDLLKKGDEPINLAARKATRWLEEKIAIAPHDGDQLLTQPIPGIYAQKEAFRATTAHIDKTRAHVVATRLGTADQAEDHAAKDAFGLEGAPRYLRELLAACVYCQTACASEVEFKVALAYPPAHVQDSMMAAHAAAGDRPSYLVRTDGRATEAWLDAYSVPFEVVPTSKTWTGEKQSSRFRTHASSSHDADLRSEPSKSTRPEAGHSTATARGRATSSSPSELDSGHFGRIDAEEGPIIARPSSPASSAASFRTSFTASTTSTHDDRSQRSAHSASSVRIVRHPADSSSAKDDTEQGSKWCRLTSRTLHKTRSGADKMEDYLRRLEAGASAAPVDRPDRTRHDPR